MEITVHKEGLSEWDTGGGVRDLTCRITIDSNLSPRIQRQVVIYETLGALMGQTLSHRQLEDLTDHLIDALDQL